MQEKRFCQLPSECCQWNPRKRSLWVSKSRVQSKCQVSFDFINFRIVNSTCSIYSLLVFVRIQFTLLKTFKMLFNFVHIHEKISTKMNSSVQVAALIWNDDRLLILKNELIFNVVWFRYSQVNGVCNHLKNPNVGMAKMPYNRILAPAYADGMYYKLCTKNKKKQRQKSKKIQIECFVECALK